MHSKRSPQQPRRNLVQWTLISEEGGGGRCGRDNMSIDYGMMRVAQQKTREINAAYDRVKEERNIK